MTTIPITVSGKVAICQNQYLISANEDYVLSFSFDEDWDVSGVKTARLLIDDAYLDLVFTGTTVALPRIPPCTELSVGVFSDVCASTSAFLGCIRSVADTDATPASEFTPTQYDQIVALLNNADLRQIDTVTRSGSTLTFAFRDGTTTAVALFDGVGIQSAATNANGHLLLTLTDGTTLDAGFVRGDPGAPGTLDETTFEAMLSQKFQAHFDACVAALGNAEGGTF